MGRYLAPRLKALSPRAISTSVALVVLAAAGVLAGVGLADLGSSGDTCDWVAGAGNSATVVITIPATPKQGGAAFGAPGGLTVTSASFAGIPGTFGTNGLPPGTSGEDLLSGSTQLNPSGAATVTVSLGLSGPAPSSGNFTVVPTNSPPSDYFSSVSCGPFATSTSTTATTSTGTTAGPTPHVSGVDPSTGVRSGGTNVTISGSGFTGATSVRFGTADAMSFSVVSDTQITAVAPAYDTAGTVPVHVTGPGGHSQNLISGGNGFKYTDPPKTTTSTTTATTTATSTTTTPHASLGPSGIDCTWSGVGGLVTLSLSGQDRGVSIGGAAFGASGGLTVTSAAFPGAGTAGTSGLPAGTTVEEFLASPQPIDYFPETVVTLRLSGDISGTDYFRVVPMNAAATGYYNTVDCDPEGFPAPADYWGDSKASCAWRSAGSTAFVTVTIPAGAPPEQGWAFAVPGVTIQGVTAPGTDDEKDWSVSFFPYTIGLLQPVNDSGESTQISFALSLSGAVPAGDDIIVWPQKSLYVFAYGFITCAQGGVGGSSTTTGGSSPPTPAAAYDAATATAELPAAVPSAGTVTWSQSSTGHEPRATSGHPTPHPAGRLIEPGKLVAAKAGTVTLELKPTAAGKSLLDANGSLSVSLSVTFKPTTGAPHTNVTTVTLKARAPSGPIASIAAARVASSPTGRTLTVKLHVSEAASAKLILRTRGAPYTDTVQVKSGSSTLTVPLPKWLGAGKGRLLVVLTDPAHRTRRYQATMSVPAAS